MAQLYSDEDHYSSKIKMLEILSFQQFIISNSIKRGALAIERPARRGSFSKITKWPESSGTFNSQSPLYMLFLCNIMFA